jgi:NAD(P)H-dependent flavin oxidoreductase YrpB (nitropropane dioxygenase family)
MDNAICRMTGAEFPLFAFSHCRDVVAAVSRAGGFGVLGCSSHGSHELEAELAWIDAHVDGRPYGVDILFPQVQQASSGMTMQDFVAAIPDRHVDFVVELLASHGVEIRREEVIRDRLPPTAPDEAEALLDIAFRHPVRLIANALGVAPPRMIARARAAGVPVAALVGTKAHAVKQAQAGVDIIVAQGTEAAGHCGEVTTMVLVPEVIRAVAAHGAPPVLAAGGIVTGEQMAGAMAMGAQGAWTGTVWLATTEAETSPAVRDKIVAARSTDTVRSLARSGKPNRQLKSAWNAAWDAPDSPGALPLPLMPLICVPAMQRIARAAEAGSTAAQDLLTYESGQGVGMIDAVRSASAVVQDFKTQFAEAFERFVGVVGAGAGG